MALRKSYPPSFLAFGILPIVLVYMSYEVATYWINGDEIGRRNRHFLSFHAFVLLGWIFVALVGYIFWQRKGSK